MLAPALAEILRAQRDSFNARFTAARRRWSHLDPNDFSLFLRDQLSPFTAAVAISAPDRAATVTHIGYDLGLQLVAEKLAGPSARDASINQLWSSCLPTLAALIAADPRRLLASLTNATHQLATSSGTHLDLWHQQLTALGPRCANPNELLALAQLLAWRAGFAHYRTSALNAAAALPDFLALTVLGVSTNTSWSTVRAACLANPWHGYAAHKSSSIPGSAGGPPASSSIASFRRVGAFRGFGGLFLTPPLVSVSGDHFLARSGDEAWLLIADSFGATFHRASPAELSAATSLKFTAPKITPPDFPNGHTVTSSAVIGFSAAFTSAQSHAVWIGPAAALSS